MRWEDQEIGKFYLSSTPGPLGGSTTEHGVYDSLADATMAARAIHKANPDFKHFSASEKRSHHRDGAFVDGVSHRIVLEPRFSLDAEVVRKDGTSVFMRDVHAVFTHTEYDHLVGNMIDWLAEHGVDGDTVDAFDKSWSRVGAPWQKVAR